MRVLLITIDIHVCVDFFFLPTFSSISWLAWLHFGVCVLSSTSWLLIVSSNSSYLKIRLHLRIERRKLVDVHLLLFLLNLLGKFLLKLHRILSLLNLLFALGLQLFQLFSLPRLQFRLCVI